MGNRQPGTRLEVGLVSSEFEIWLMEMFEVVIRGITIGVLIGAVVGGVMLYRFWRNDQQRRKDQT